MDAVALVLSTVSLVASLGAVWWNTREGRERRRADYRYRCAVELTDLLVQLGDELREVDEEFAETKSEYNERGDEIVEGVDLPVPPIAAVALVPRIVARAASLESKCAIDLHWNLFEWEQALAECRQAPSDVEAVAELRDWPRQLRNSVRAALGETRDIAIGAGKEIGGERRQLSKTLRQLLPRRLVDRGEERILG
jgi:hypothetical protein